MAEESSNKGAKGRCLCGGVSYTVDGPLRDVIVCHCDECRRSSGGQWHASAAWRDTVEIEDTQGHLAWYQSGPKSRRGFCRECGASLFFDHDERDYLVINAGNLEKPTGLKLARHIFTGEAGDYYDVPADAEHFEAYPDILPMPAK